jgi:hypothetical protein
MPFYPQSVASQRTYPNSLSFHCFHLRLAYESIKELGGVWSWIFFSYNCISSLTTLGIPRSQIEIIYIFSIVKILINLLWYQLGMQDLNKLVMIFKNWLNNVRHVALLLEGWKIFSLLKSYLMIMREELEKIEYFENDCPIIEWWKAFWFWIFNI